ncbi:Shedu anti-phage system protein SduA domain-containing protein [Sporomusa sphaeroides]|uniref:Shedu anti-phage system protein SduA domain-containing protein n=1 Tax=Sporomusa sphaeroides TaxID=47679 RepID=UPI002B9AB4F9|nr:Shedu anti-phage system protein SduA domain-containing protein [Sporomusa sphaeroides]HML35729.1 DUF4263 domain-containing protein [Sporomusa sphaeroides]
MQIEVDIIKISDFIYRYPVRFGRPDGICRVRIFVNKQNEIYVVLTELYTNNTSAFVENAFTMIKHSLINKGHIPRDAMFIIHEEKVGRAPETFRIVKRNESYDDIFIDIDRALANELCSCYEDEFSQDTIEIPYLNDQIIALRHEINPYADFPFPENCEVVRRKIEIDDNKIRKSQINDLINEECQEQSLSSLLKRDLSLFAEIYACPKDEYICFSEYEINNKYVDFVVFTGRSRMDVILIEIKGADFYFSKKNHYGNLNNKIDEAAQQIRIHDRYLSSHYEEFRQQVHCIRKQVEEGKRIYNSLLCPQGYLHVDPDKDINIRKVIIGGKTRNDLDDSKKRTEFERNQGVYFLDTWDSWLKKLQRS